MIGLLSICSRAAISSLDPGTFASLQISRYSRKNKRRRFQTPVLELVEVSDPAGTRRWAFKEPFAVRHQEFLVYAFAKETFHLKFVSVTFSDPNSKKNTGGPFWNPLVPLKTTQ